MHTKLTNYRGCLLGLAVGDAMGYTVDDRNWDEIRRDYGPNGLLGYDLVNGYADVTSHTQLAAFACNGLLLGLTQGQMRGSMAPYIRYLRLAEREWAAGQRYGAPTEKIFCWIYGDKTLRGRRCMDTRMLDTLNRDRLGTPEEPRNRFNTLGAATVGVSVGLFYHPDRLPHRELLRLGAEAVALTHGSPQAFLTGAALAHIISRIVWDGADWLPALFDETLEALDRVFAREYPQGVQELRALAARAMALAQDESVHQADAMEELGCGTMPEVLAGAMYACLTCRGSFDAAMITAVNHSGRSAAVGALTGAILGAQMGDETLPDFYLESLEPVEVLRELADDLYQGCPMDRTSCMYDDDWARKYIHCGR